jgi:hypothetical protein
MRELFAEQANKTATRKQDKSLSTECLACFKASILSVNRIDKCTTVAHFESVKALVVSYTEHMARLVEQGVHVDEVKNVQSMSFELFTNICNIVLEEYAGDFKIEKKDTSSIDLQYTTVLCAENGKVFHVSGETDATLLYCNTPIQTWEDKDLSKDATLTNEIAQPLAEVAGMAERFKGSVGVEAPNFWGVLTTGLVWTMSVRSFSEGRPVYTRTAPIKTWDCERRKINEDHVERITSLLLNALLSAEKLIKIVQRSQKSQFSGHTTFRGHFRLL